MGLKRARDETGERRGGLARRSLEEADRVLRDAAIADLEVQVGAGGPPRSSGFGDLGSALHDLPLLDEEPGAMRVARGEVVAVVDLDQIAVLGMGTRVDHDAAGSGENRGADVHREIEP